MGKHLERAKELRAIVEPHYNCAQSVLIPYAEDLGMDLETAVKVAANFGGGMKTGGTCGAITGGLMVLGLYGVDQPQAVRRLFDQVKANHDGYTDCKDLLRSSAEKGIARGPHCDGLVYEIIEVLDEILNQD